MISETTIKLNPNLEALGYKKTIGIFVGDKTITLRGEDSLELFLKLKKAFASPVSQKEIALLDSIIQQNLPDLLKNGILVEDKPTNNTRIKIFGKGKVVDRIQNLIKNYEGSLQIDRSILICFPDAKGLSVQKAAAGNLAPDEALLTGFSRSTTVFMLPLITDKNTNILNLFTRLLAMEPGVGNLYLANELSEDAVDILPKTSLDDHTAEWVAQDLFAQLRTNSVSTDTAHIYRGTQVIREDIYLGHDKDKSINIRNEDSLEEKAEILLKNFVGKGKIIHKFREDFIGDEQHSVYVANADFIRPRAKCLVEKETYDSWGMGETRAAARVATFMEAIERYSSCAYSLEDYPLRSRNKLDIPVLDRLALTGYGKTDKFFEDIPADQPRRWHIVKDLHNGTLHAAPLELVRYPVDIAEADYAVQDEITSSGVAAHLSYDLAVKNACHELAERDAFMIAWLRKASPPLIDMNSLPERAKREVSFLQRKGWKVKIADFSTDIAPVMCALVSRDSASYRYSIGASSNDNPEQACIKALREAQSSFHLPMNTPRSPDKVLDDLNTPSDHMELYGSEEHQGLLLNLFSSDQIKPYSEIQTYSDKITDRLQKLGLKAFVADLAVKEVENISPSIKVVRVLVPGLVPIYFGLNWARTGSPRIQNIPSMLNWKTGASSESEYQRFPHPFP